MSHMVDVFVPARHPVEQLLPDGSHADALSLGELQRIRELIRGSVDRTQAELDRVEALILAATLRENRRGGSEGVRGIGTGSSTERS